MLNKIKKHYLILLASYLSEDCPYLCRAFEKMGFRKIFLRKEYEMLKLLAGRETFYRYPLFLSNFCDFEPPESKRDFFSLQLRLEIVKSWIELLDSDLLLQEQVEITRRQVRREMNEAFK